MCFDGLCCAQTSFRFVQQLIKMNARFNMRAVSQQFKAKTLFNYTDQIVNDHLLQYSSTVAFIIIVHDVAFAFSPQQSIFSLSAIPGNRLFPENPKAPIS